MSWPIPPVPDYGVPLGKQSTSPFYWFLGLLFLFLVIDPLVLYWWPEDRSTRDLKFWYLIVLLPLLIWSLALWIYYVIRLNQSQQYKSWEQEKHNIRRRWQQWGQEHLAVIYSALVLPESLDAGLIIGGAPAAPTRLGQAHLFARGEQAGALQNQFYDRFIAALAPLIRPLPAGTLLTVHLVMPDEADFPVEKETFERCWLWSDSVSALPVTVQYLAPGLSVFDTLRDRGVEGLHIMIAVALNADQNAPGFSETASCLAVSMPQLAAALPVKAVLPRSVVVDNEADMARCVEQCLMAQASAEVLAHVWQVGVEKKMHNELLIALGQHGVNLFADTETSGLHAFDLYVGNPSPLSHWAALAITIDALDAGGQPQLLASTCAGQTQLNFVAKSLKQIESPQ